LFGHEVKTMQTVNEQELKDFIDGTTA